jgi:hypothetical protein
MYTSICLNRAKQQDNFLHVTIKEISSKVSADYLFTFAALLWLQRSMNCMLLMLVQVLGP